MEALERNGSRSVTQYISSINSIRFEAAQVISQKSYSANDK